MRVIRRAVLLLAAAGVAGGCTSELRTRVDPAGGDVMFEVTLDEAITANLTTSQIEQAFVVNGAAVPKIGRSDGRLSAAGSYTPDSTSGEITGVSAVDVVQLDDGRWAVEVTVVEPTALIDAITTSVAAQPDAGPLSAAATAATTVAVTVELVDAEIVWAPDDGRSSYQPDPDGASVTLSASADRWEAGVLQVTGVEPADSGRPLWWWLAGGGAVAVAAGVIVDRRRRAGDLDS